MLTIHILTKMCLPNSFSMERFRKRRLYDSNLVFWISAACLTSSKFRTDLKNDSFQSGLVSRARFLFRAFCSDELAVFSVLRSTSSFRTLALTVGWFETLALAIDWFDTLVMSSDRFGTLTIDWFGDISLLMPNDDEGVLLAIKLLWTDIEWLWIGCAFRASEQPDGWLTPTIPLIISLPLAAPTKAMQSFSNSVSFGCLPDPVTSFLSFAA